MAFVAPTTPRPTVLLADGQAGHSGASLTNVIEKALTHARAVAPSTWSLDLQVADWLELDSEGHLDGITIAAPAHPGWPQVRWRALTPTAHAAALRLFGEALRAQSLKVAPPR
jgi:hypothetical protein